MTTSRIGEEGLRWFFGVVEDRDDPKKLGRVRVRIYNVHPFTSSGEPDTSKVPKDHLPWAMPINSIISAGVFSEDLDDGVGLSPTGMMVGTTVVGFFADGNECQIPIILGTTAGLVGDEEENETPKHSREIDEVNLQKSEEKVDADDPFPGEPESPYESKYPFNKAFRSESGHLIEIDDTPNKERIQIYHKTGTYVEINEEGRLVTKVVSDKFDVTVSDNNIYIGGNENKKVNGDVNVTIAGDVNIKVEGKYTLEAGDLMTFKAPRIDLNPD